MSNARDKAQAFTKQLVGQMVGDDRAGLRVVRSAGQGGEDSERQVRQYPPIATKIARRPVAC